MIKWDASHPIRWISSRGIYSEHWIGIAEKTKQNNAVIKVFFTDYRDLVLAIVCI